MFRKTDSGKPGRAGHGARVTGAGALKIFSLVAMLVFAACVSTGRNFDVSKVKMIKKNVTGRSQIQGWFGYPYMTGLDNGDKTWIYNYTKTSVTGETLTKNLYIVFGPSGQVKSYTFSTSFPEEIATQP